MSRNIKIYCTKFKMLYFKQFAGEINYINSAKFENITV